MRLTSRPYAVRRASGRSLPEENLKIDAASPRSDGPRSAGREPPEDPADLDRIELTGTRDQRIRDARREAAPSGVHEVVTASDPDGEAAEERVAAPDRIRAAQPVRRQASVTFGHA